MAVGAQQVFRAIITADAGGAIKEYKKYEGTVDKSTTAAAKQLGKTEKALSRVKMAAGAMGAMVAVQVGRYSVNAARDLEESINAVNVMYDKSATSVLKLSESAAEGAGLSKRKFNEAAVSVGAFVDQISRISGQNTAAVLDDLITRGADFASVFNIEVDEAMQRFRSGLAGETEPLRRFGINLLQSEVAAYAAANGIGEVGRQMTEEEKVAARYALLMEKTAAMQGDFARTSGDLANSQRVLRAKLENTAAAFGDALVPVVSIAVDGLQAAFDAVEAFGVTDAIQVMATLFEGLRDDSAAIAVAFQNMTVDPDATELNRVFRLTNLANDLRDAQGFAADFKDTLNEVAAPGWWSSFFGVESGAAKNAWGSIEDAIRGIASTNPEAAIVLLNDMQAIIEGRNKTGKGYDWWREEWGLTPERTAALKAEVIDLAGYMQKTGSENFRGPGREWTTSGSEAATRAITEQDIALQKLNGTYNYVVGDMEVWDEVQKNAEESAAAATAALEAQAAAAVDWYETMNGSFSSAASSISDFSDDAMADLDTWQQELRDNIIAANDWQTNLINIAKETSPEFAAFLGEMGLAGAGLVADMANNGDELQESFAIYSWSAGVTRKDMVAEFAKFSPEVRAILEQMPAGTSAAWDLIRDNFETLAWALGKGIGSGVRVGIDASEAQVDAAMWDLVQSALHAGQTSAKVRSPSRLFAEEIGMPIGEGIAEGVEDAAGSIASALGRAIDGAASEAKSAAQGLVDAVNAVYDGLWDEIDAEERTKTLVESVSDAENRLAALRDDPESDPESLSDAAESVRRAYLELFKERDLVNPTSAYARDTYGIAQKAGLSDDQYSALRLAAKEKNQAQQNFDVWSAQQDTRLAVAHGVVDGFSQLALSGGATGDALGTAAGQTFVTLNLTAGLGVDGVDLGRQIVEVLKRYESVNGTRWRSP